MSKRDEELTEQLLGTIDPVDFQRELAPGVRLGSVDAHWKSSGKKHVLADGNVLHGPYTPAAVLLYSVHGWTVTMTSGNLFRAAPPIELTVRTDDRATRDRGVTTEVLRAIPLADARRRIRAMGRALLEAEQTPWYELGRLTTDRDWAKFAEAYAGVVELGDRSPVTHLAERSGTSRNTVAARVRIARDKGFLTRPTDESLGELTDMARELLDEGEEN